jgi:soluble epoxide hydrolase/lipid-phosphate phosphatase
MESINTSQLTTTRSLTYTYLKTPPTQENKPYILFLHGFPSSVFHYRHQISYFTKAGYGIIAPTLLGYGKTSKPADYSVYSGKGMSQDIQEILRYEKIDSVIGVGHDWYHIYSRNFGKG